MREDRKIRNNIHNIFVEIFYERQNGGNWIFWRFNDLSLNEILEVQRLLYHLDYDIISREESGHTSFKIYW